MKSEVFARDTLRIICYVGSGVIIWEFPWYFGVPLGALGIFLGQALERLKYQVAEKGVEKC